MYGESNTETYATMCHTDSQQELAVRLRELEPGLGNNLEAWDGEGGGREVHEAGNIWTCIADSQCCRADSQCCTAESNATL